jgi:3alpha(or 20beta)-hydroxysteroid dehydrogenase
MTMDYNTALRLDGKTALVTGAARGLGAEIAQALLQAGASVLLSDVLCDVGEKTLDTLTARFPGKAAFIRHDVTLEADWEAATAAAIAQFGGLDVVVNNAGIETAALFAECELADFKRTMAVNVEGSFLGIKHGIRAMRVGCGDGNQGGPAGKGGAIVNLSSVAGLIGSPGLGAYCASKGAVRVMSKAAAVECGRLGYGIRVNSVHPSIVKTAMGVSVIEQLVSLGMAPDAASAEAFVSSMHPIGLGLPSDVASAVLFLASDAARWVTGAELVIDGGLTAT